MKSRTTLLAFLVGASLHAQDYRWQQRVEYVMDVKLNVSTHLLTGTQRITYYNNSPDTLRRVYFHLFFNAFQPGSFMDVRSRNIADPDSRVGTRIRDLQPDEYGYQKILSLRQDGKEVGKAIQGTLMEVSLLKPLLPRSKAVFDIQLEAQVPKQIRRSGRDSREGIAYTMTQWYPKMAEYDANGWHAYPYVAREFHGVFGDFDVKITLDRKFVVGGTGRLMNPDKVGHGYEKPGITLKLPEGDLTWNFVAKNVIDFAWAADPDYTHTVTQVPGGPELHFLYQKNERTQEHWSKLPEATAKHFQFMNEHYGRYPYEVFSVICAGDGGMEYPMCTMITGERNYQSLVGVTAHEASHSWYPMVLASNESLYAWMDEGFADFTADESLMAMGLKPTGHSRSYDSYFNLVKSGLQEPMSQHSDHFSTNRAYSTAAYSMGAVFLCQLQYLMGKETFEAGMRRYFNAWKFRHPEPNDFIRVMEKASGQQLQWFMRYWVGTTKKIDYSIDEVVAQGTSTIVTLRRVGEFPMPVELKVNLRDGRSRTMYVACSEQMAPWGSHSDTSEVLPVWNWVDPSYQIRIEFPASQIESIEVDPGMNLADIYRENNKVELSSGTLFQRSGN
jgi:hypothetical protein